VTLLPPPPPRPSDHRQISPRPFPLHLALAGAALTSSKAGLPISNGVSPNSKPVSNPRCPNPLWPDLPASLAAELARFPSTEISAALDRAIVRAAAEYADGIEAYRRHPYRRLHEDDSVVWRLGSASLLRHGPPVRGNRKGGSARVPALFAPSLLNRGWVLDLVPGEGMLSWLAVHGVDPYRIEWGPPDAVERGFDVGDYIRLRLEPALHEVRRLTGQPPVLVGYCMGGLLALAAALRRKGAIRALVLLATPWDFHAEGGARGVAMAGMFRAARPLLELAGELPVDIIQALFATHDPIVALRKFRRFAGMDPASPEATTFVALEDWLNDGVPLALPAADEALLGWYDGNETVLGAWRVGGVAIDPAALAMPSLVVVPGGDRIVPPASAAALASKLPGCDRFDVPLGHIGMVVGRRAPEALWAPLAEWIAARACAPRGMG
jgi:polyhydroxyalkanoate synthase